MRSAMGDRFAEDTGEMDDLFVRHTYLSAVIGMVVQASFGIDIHCSTPTPVTVTTPWRTYRTGDCQANGQRTLYQEQLYSDGSRRTRERTQACSYGSWGEWRVVSRGACVNGQQRVTSVRTHTDGRAQTSNRYLACSTPTPDPEPVTPDPTPVNPAPAFDVPVDVPPAPQVTWQETYRGPCINGRRMITFRSSEGVIRNRFQGCVEAEPDPAPTPEPVAEANARVEASEQAPPTTRQALLWTPPAQPTAAGLGTALETLGSGQDETRIATIWTPPSSTLRSDPAYQAAGTSTANELAALHRKPRYLWTAQDWNRMHLLSGAPELAERSAIDWWAFPYLGDALEHGIVGTSVDIFGRDARTGYGEVRTEERARRADAQAEADRHFEALNSGNLSPEEMAAVYELWQAATARERGNNLADAIDEQVAPVIEQLQKNADDRARLRAEMDAVKDSDPVRYNRMVREHNALLEQSEELAEKSAGVLDAAKGKERFQDVSVGVLAEGAQEVVKAVDAAEDIWWVATDGRKYGMSPVVGGYMAAAIATDLVPIVGVPGARR
ncbi:MAG: hypothetical protein F4185_02655, partial [Chloroflexi bacterium]|nr:hypothetical protein [Chloroflexota bacterium]